jgi:hypothetical protein
MIPRCLIAVLVTGACGTVARAPIDGNGSPVTYKGTLDQTPPVTFGGAPYCMYTITLKQLDVELAIVPPSQVTTGRVENLNVEAIVPQCPNGSLPPTIATYTFASATPSQSGTTLAFQGAPGNAPVVSLVVELSSAGAAYQARLGFHRTDTVPPLDWSVVTTIPLSAR